MKLKPRPKRTRRHFRRTRTTHSLGRNSAESSAIPDHVIGARDPSPRYDPASQWRFAWWQARAGFNRRYNFHALRHSAVTNVYRASRNLFLAQRFARHASPLTTIIYTHPADEELWEGIREMPC
ncbi:MAG: tyrosine-type recombinase/integrase [Candidatus Polarisedimenticolia bacterium]